MGIEQIKCKLGAMYAGYAVRCTKKMAETILLDGLYFWYGRCCDPKARHIKAGIWEVYLEE